MGWPILSAMTASEQLLETGLKVSQSRPLENLLGAKVGFGESSGRDQPLKSASGLHHVLEKRMLDESIGQ